MSAPDSDCFENGMMPLELEMRVDEEEEDDPDAVETKSDVDEPQDSDEEVQPLPVQVNITPLEEDVNFKPEDGEDTTTSLDESRLHEEVDIKEENKEDEDEVLQPPLAINIKEEKNEEEEDSVVENSSSSQYERSRRKRKVKSMPDFVDEDENSEEEILPQAAFVVVQGRADEQNPHGTAEENVSAKPAGKTGKRSKTTSKRENLNNLTMASLHHQEISSVTVRELQLMKFSELSLDEQVTVKKRGRSTPDIKIYQPGISNNKKYIRSFNSEWYLRKSWLCGCEVTNALFCFPCMMFGGDTMWTKTGFDCVGKMKEKTEKHEKSEKHIENEVSLALLGNTNVKEKLSEACRISITEHNIKVKKNREILSKIIDCIFFCENFETSLCGHDEKDDPANLVFFKGLINFACSLDPDLMNHLETSTVFKDISTTIQNEILDCLLQIYHEEIITEISKAPFVAVMADDTTDVSEHTQMVIVVRYVLNGEIFERFWGFFIPENQTADGVSKCILEQLDVILQGNGQKLIAQTFDGFVNGKKIGVLRKIKAVYRNAHYIHCYEHEVNLILRNTARVTQNARIFFSNILAIQTFFSKSPKCVSILKKHMDINNPHLSSAKWNFNLWTVKRVYRHLQSLKSCLTEIQTTSNVDHTIAEATGILKYLNDNNFMFWLKIFFQIMIHVEEIYNKMQSQEISVFQVSEYLTHYKTAILAIRNSRYCENFSKTLMAEAKEVCDNVCADIVDRYSFTKHLFSAKLFNKNSFTLFKCKLPLEEIELTSKAYPMIDKGKLESELKVFYCRSDMHEYCKLLELLKFILENKIDDVLTEITKLIQILLTIPMTTSEPERCFSALKKIKSFLKSTVNSERLNAFALLSMEKKFLISHPEMKEKIINLFAHSKTRTDLIFK